MSVVERRISARREFKAPLRFHILGSNSAQTLDGHCENVSDRGIYFTTKQPMSVGTPIEVFLTVPKELARQGQTELRCAARVVHVRPSAGVDGALGVGASVDRFEGAAARPAWQS